MSIDTNRYDRMLRTYGMEAASRINSSNVYIYGLHGGYAGEICKNLALSGLNTISLIGNETINNIDTKSSVYRNSLGEKCSSVLKKYINELNNLVNVNIEYKEIASLENQIIFLPNSVMVVINKTLEETIIINNICRKNNCKLVYLLCCGLAGSLFVDCIEHTVMDTTGEIYDTIIIKDIVMNQGCNNTHSYTIHCNSHNLNIGSQVKFSSLESNASYYFLNKTWTVIDTNSHSFKIVTESMYPSDFKFVNGTIEHIPKPTTFTHQTLSEQKIDIITSNLESLLTNQPVLKEYEYCQDIVFEPVTSLMSGFASNEIIKLITFKYTPINQWFTWSDHSLFEYTTKEDVMMKYNELVKRMKELNILMVGCGALGCEWLKNLAMLGCGEVGSIDIVDPDHIEHSNLSRQFLFRQKHVKQSKCKVAKEMITQINDKMNIYCYEHKLSNENKELTNHVFKNKDIVINCLDNVEARRYVDMMCFDRNLPLFESGTMGIKGNTMPIIPYVTETYSNMSDPPEEKQFPVCTIKHFPNQIIHTIHWARDNFELYNRGPLNCNKYTVDKNFLEGLSLVEKNQAIEDINYFLSDIPKTWEDCIIKAKDNFDKIFNHEIKQLLCCFPKDCKVNNEIFWSHGKQCPKPLELDSNNSIDYLYATSKLLCKIYGIEDDYQYEDVINMVSKPELSKVKPFVPKENVIIAKDDAELGKIENPITKIDIKIVPCHLNPQEFEKDDDSNYHIEYITAASNCRANNYNIPIASKYETKGIAGRIIPAVATTTSTVVGLIGMELLRYVVGNQKIENYRSWFMNMADNMVLYSEPIAMPEMTVNSKKLNGWTKLKYIQNTTLREFINYYEKIFDITITIILHETSIVYSDFTEDNTMLQLSDIFKDKDIVTLVAEDSSINLPPIILEF